MKTSNDDSYSSCGRSDGSDVGSAVSSLVSVCMFVAFYIDYISGTVVNFSEPSVCPRAVE